MEWSDAVEHMKTDGCHVVVHVDIDCRNSVELACCLYFFFSAVQWW